MTKGPKGAGGPGERDPDRGLAQHGIGEIAKTEPGEWHSRDPSKTEAKEWA